MHGNKEDSKSISWKTLKKWKVLGIGKSITKGGKSERVNNNRIWGEKERKKSIIIIIQKRERERHSNNSKEK